MNITIANALFGYLKTLYEMNQTLIKLCGIDIIDDLESGKMDVLNIIQNVPRIIPYEYELLHIFREELLAEAKRLVPICYEEKDLFKCSSEKIRKKINPKYKEFEIHIHLMMISLCNLKAEKKDYKKYQIDYEDLAEHHINYIKWKFKINRCDLNDVTELIATDIIKNKYKNESLFTLIPKLSKKHMKCHNDSVDCECVVMLLEEKLNNKGYNLLSSNFFDLKKLA